MEASGTRQLMAGPRLPITNLNIPTESLVPQFKTIMASEGPAGTSPSCTSSGANTESFTDSGYNTQPTTPSGKASESEKTKLIAKDVDEPTLDRFKAIQPAFEEFLLERMRSRQKPGTTYAPLSIRVAMMGTSVDDARPYIIVFCESSLKSAVQGFIKQDVITNLCQPGDPVIPSFKVVAHGNAPRLHTRESEIKVITDTTCIHGRNRESTLCGVPISFRTYDGNRRHATFGGIIRVTNASGEIELLGITAGHALRQLDDVSVVPHDSEASVEDGRSDLLIDEESLVRDSDVEEIIIDEDEGDIEVEIEPPTPSESSMSTLDIGSRWEFKHTAALGSVVGITGSTKRQGLKQNYDWALLRLTTYAMNYARTSRGSKELRTISQRKPGTMGKRSISMLNGFRGRRRGTLLSEPGRILLENGLEFIDSFMITINGKTGVCDGDSGSWVVDAETFEVYGQLVASDALGGGYVIPMVGIMDDIKSQLGAKSVGLPGPAIILYASTIMMAEARYVARKRRLSHIARPKDYD